ncbi:MAG TPA: MerR family transcriptional regulator [Trebonia sp.]|nr:MerR family transcriptional regulator [Trebonia sp.]
MFSIGEFAQLGGVSIRTLRHYDEIGLLRPAFVNPETGYRGYQAVQLRQLNRVIALKELGLSLTQARQLVDGVTVEELQGMLLLRRAQLERELTERSHQLLGVEARLRFIAREDAMPADDIMEKTIPATGAVVIATKAQGVDPRYAVPAVNQISPRLEELSTMYGIKGAGPRVIFFENMHEEEATICLALPVAEEPTELPAGLRYRVLPQIEAAAAVRTGPASGIFPVVFHDLVQWIESHGYEPVLDGLRDVWIHEIDDIADADQQVFEIQMPFTRPQAG